MKRLALLLVLCLLSLCACSRQAPPSEQASSVVVGFSQLGAESSWRIANTASMEKAAAASGYGLMMDNANQKQEKQIAAIRSFISYRVDVIVLAPIVETGWDNVLNEARSAGIPVLLMDRMIETDDDALYTGYVGADFYAEGERAGLYLLRKADAMGAGRLKVVEISGTIDSTPMRDRHRGFADAVAGDPRIEVIDSVSGDFLRSKGGQVMTTLLEKYGAEGIDVIYSHNDAMTLGALDVLEENGIVPGRDMVVITVDGEAAAVDALKEGRVNCVVECTPDLGQSVMELVGRLTSGEEIPKVSHPEEGYYSDFDDLEGDPPEGF
ncbi:MAG: ABC transporter substrate-binding protein [Clostridia bacterium]|nr:ABC transporter substrate-binding protein [Clostridia bacterium]